MKAALANSLWWMSCLPSWRAFRRALLCPQATQEAILRCLLRDSSGTKFGREHGFDKIHNYAEFTSRVLIRDYWELEPWIDRIRLGEPNVLTADRVTRLVPTSGTTRARKLIPWTRGLQREFSRAIGAWIVDLFHSDPQLMAGPAYWSITPAIQDQRHESSAVPIGFDQDSEYLGGIRRHLVDWTMAVPSSVRHAADLDSFRRTTVEHLLRRKDLRLISIWHPSFLDILLKDVPDDPHRLWPHLRLISCWADGPATGAAEQLRQRSPGIRLQPKGLIATEALISIPFGSQHPLAVTSHFLEFLDESGRPHLAHELRQGAQYEVVVSTGGGLWRYRLNDVIRVDGFAARTPSVRFVGKSGHISDRFGEKLSEAFVSGVLSKLSAQGRMQAAFTLLAPEQNAYVLYIQGSATAGLAAALDQLLRDNPHYAYCRDLGQLAAPRVFRVTNSAHVAYLTRLHAQGRRLGDIKPSVLSTLENWGDCLVGDFIG